LGRRLPGIPEIQAKGLTAKVAKNGRKDREEKRSEFSCELGGISLRALRFKALIS
jgi:hypothetical protein